MNTQTLLDGTPLADVLVLTSQEGLAKTQPNNVNFLRDFTVLPYETEFELKLITLEENGVGVTGLRQAYEPRLPFPGFFTFIDDPENPEKHIGNSFIIWFSWSLQRWVCNSTEHLREANHEHSWTQFPLDNTRILGGPNDIDMTKPVYVGCATPMRSVPAGDVRDSLPNLITNLGAFDLRMGQPWDEQDAPDVPDEPTDPETPDDHHAECQQRIKYAQDGWDEAVLELDLTKQTFASLAEEWDGKAAKRERKGGNKRLIRAEVYRACAADQRRLLDRREPVMVEDDDGVASIQPETV